MMNLSGLTKTWLIDIDGTIFQHNGYKNGEDVLLDGVHEFFDSISSNDAVVLLTARSELVREQTELALKKITFHMTK